MEFSRGSANGDIQSGIHRGAELTSMASYDDRTCQSHVTMNWREYNVCLGFGKTVGAHFVKNFPSEGAEGKYAIRISWVAMIFGRQDMVDRAIGTQFGADKMFVSISEPRECQKRAAAGSKHASHFTQRGPVIGD